MASAGTIVAGVILLVIGGLTFVSGSNQASSCQQYNNLFQQDTYQQCLTAAQQVEAIGGVLALLGIILIPVGAAVGGSKPPTVIVNPSPPAPVYMDASGGAYRNVTFPPPAPPPRAPPAAPAQTPGAAPAQSHLFCPWCGTERVTSAPFCAGCGRAFSAG